MVEETRPGEYLPVYENERGTFLFNSKDLCMVEHIPELLKAGIDSFKVEGRMKTALYVASIARAYRMAIDHCLASEEVYRENLEWYRAEVSKCTNRRYTTGFYFGRPDADSQIYDSSTYVNEYVYLGIVDGEGTYSGIFGRDCPGLSGGQEAQEGLSGEQDVSLVRIEQRNKFSVGDVIEVMRPDGRDEQAVVKAMYDEAGNPMDSCPHPKQAVWLELSAKAGQYDLLRAADQRG